MNVFQIFLGTWASSQRPGRQKNGREGGNNNKVSTIVTLIVLTLDSLFFK